MRDEGACQACPGCVSKSGCNEYNRLYFQWDRAARNFHTRSVTTGVSYQFNLVTADLSKYQALLEEIKAGSLDIDLALDELPDDHPHRNNVRYSRERLEHDVLNKEAHLSRVIKILQEHQAHQACLDEVKADNLQFGPQETTGAEGWLSLTETAAAQRLEKVLEEVDLTSDQQVVELQGDNKPKMDRMVKEIIGKAKVVSELTSKHKHNQFF